jgi:hypothetical protein
VRSDDEGEGESVPVLVGVGWVFGGGLEGGPVLAVVVGDVGAVGAYGDPEFLLGVIGYGGATKQNLQNAQLKSLTVSRNLLK